MYLSLLALNPRSRQVRREIADCYQMHRTVWSGFPAAKAEEERVLYRLETDARSGDIRLLVQSLGRPDWSSLAGASPGAAAYLVEGCPENPVIKQFDLALAAGRQLRFRLVANPTVRRSQRAEKAPGKRVSLLGEEEQLRWLDRKGEAAGFRLLEARVSPSQRITGWKQGDDGWKQLTIDRVCFEGRLEVGDPDRLRRTVAEGVGSAKGFGCGLLSLAPA